jgi:membrane-associated phospholipid phosphatase
MHVLSFLTNFGDPFLTVPVAITIQCWLIAMRQWRAARCWGVGFVGGAGLVALSKFAYAGWNIGIAAVHFTGVSGHTMLSAAVYPVAAAICANRATAAMVRRAIQLGAVFSLLIGVSRVAFGYHSWSEVVSGWLLGGYVATLTLRAVLQRSSLQRTGASDPQHGQLWSEALLDASPERATVAQRQSPEHHAIPRHGTAIFSAVLVVIALTCHGRAAPMTAWIFNIAPKVAELISAPDGESLARLSTSPAER